MTSATICSLVAITAAAVAIIAAHMAHRACAVAESRASDAIASALLAIEILSSSRASARAAAAEARASSLRLSHSSARAELRELYFPVARNCLTSSSLSSASRRARNDSAVSTLATIASARAFRLSSKLLKTETPNVQGQGRCAIKPRRAPCTAGLGLLAHDGAMVILFESHSFPVESLTRARMSFHTLAYCSRPS